MNAPPARSTRFAGFILDRANARLRRGDDFVSLRPKTLAVLCCLVDRAGNLVSKSDLLDEVWPEAVVAECVLAGCVQELRRLLSDDPRRPRIIETVHRRGYRFIATIDAGAGENAAHRSATATRTTAAAGNVVARERELAELLSWLRDARSGHRQVGFVVGEAGIGKTSVLEAFRDAAMDAGTDLVVAQGQCIEWRSDGDSPTEPYLALLEALAGACSTAAGAKLLDGLRRSAPSWLGLLPGVLDADEARVLAEGARGTTRERLALELTRFCAALEQPLLFILEDLHWSDAATLDLLAAIAQRREPTPLLIVGSYRPAGAAAQGHVVRSVHHSLRARGLCRELWLEPFDEGAVETYLSKSCPGLDPADATVVARTVFGRTDGNPLFVANVTQHLKGEGLLLERDGAWQLATTGSALVSGVPPGLRQMIGTQIDGLEEADREVLETGSLCGLTFSSELVAAAIGCDQLSIESRLEDLARRGIMLRSAGEQTWPDGTVASAYALTHALHGEVLRDRLPSAVRKRSHRRIADRLAEAWKGRSGEIATELAFHFDASGDAESASLFFEEAASRASRIGAHREAVAFLEKGISAIDALPSSPERRLRTLRLCMQLGQTHQAPGGYGAPEAEKAFDRAHALAEALDDPVQLFQASVARTAARVAQGRLVDAAATARQVLELIERLPVPAFEVVGKIVVAMVRYHEVKLDEARRLLEQALAGDAAELPPTMIDFRVLGLNYLGLTYFHMGHANLARETGRQAMRRAGHAGTPFDRASAAGFACFVLLKLGDFSELAGVAAQAETIGREYGFPMQAAMGRFAQGMMASARGDIAGGIAAIEDAIAIYRQTGSMVILPNMLAGLAEVRASRGDGNVARRLLDEAISIASSVGEPRMTVENQRVEAELCRAAGDVAGARRHYGEAIDMANRMGGRAQELRACLGLASLAGHEEAGRACLQRVVTTLDGRGDSVDLVAARRLLVRSNATGV